MVRQIQLVSILVCFAVFVVSVSSTTMMRPPQRRNEFTNTEDVVRFLKQLDDYYSVVSRPRFGKRASINQHMQDWAQDQGEMEDYQNKYQVSA